MTIEPKRALTSAIGGGLFGLLVALPMASGRVSVEPVTSGLRHALTLARQMAMMIVAPGPMVGPGAVGLLLNALLWAATVVMLRARGTEPRLKAARVGTTVVWGAWAVVMVAAVLLMDGD